MRTRCRCLCVLMLWTFAILEGRLVLQKGAFLQLPDSRSKYIFGAGTASKASYDYQENLLYVIGHKADVLHVVDMHDPRHPILASTKVFSKVNQGLPNFIKVCRKNTGEGFLAVSFESPGKNQKGHVHFYELLQANEAYTPGSLHHKLSIVTTESYDPRPIAWSSNCKELVVASEGDPHQLNGVFEDPPADLEILIPGFFGTTVNRRDIPISESHAEAAHVRHVFKRCDSGDGRNQTSSLLQDLEPTAVHVDRNDVAYIIFQENNAIATLDLKDAFSQMTFYSLGTKDWSRYAFDGSYDDHDKIGRQFFDNCAANKASYDPQENFLYVIGIQLKSRKLVSFYQPKDMVSFELDGKVWLATADTGSIRRYSLSTCRFDESVTAASWRQPFSDGLSPEEVNQLKAEMASVGEIGRLTVSKLKTATDGWDMVFEGYDFVSTFGGRGFSVLDPADMSRVYDSGDDFERYFTTAEATEAEKVMYNGALGATNTAQSASFDKRSVELGPTPSAIAAGSFNSSVQVLVIANGVVGGLYLYSVTSGPVVTFESFVRRGQAGLTWAESYSQNTTDAVGEPSITDLLFIDDEGLKTVVAVSSAAGALSFYSLQDL